MSRMRFVDEPVVVEARFDEGGQATPLAFVWRGRRYPISEVGRHQMEDWEGKRVHCYPVMTPTRQTFELCLELDSLCWRLRRVWETGRAV